MGLCSRRTTITAALPQISALWQSCLTQASPQCKTHESPFGVQKSTWRTLGLWGTRLSALIKSRLNCLASILKSFSGRNQASLIIYPILSQQQSTVGVASCCGGVSQLQGLGDWSRLMEVCLSLFMQLPPPPSDPTPGIPSPYDDMFRIELIVGENVMATGMCYV